MYTKRTRVSQIKTALKLLMKDPKILILKILSLTKPPLFLFQMGKVASKTHDKTLCHLYFVQHFHSHIEFDAAVARGTRKFKSEKYQPYDMITATRDPITRKISAFFQNITGHYAFSFETLDEAKKAGIDELIERFQSWGDGINEATGWFDKHFLPKTKIDVYDFDFNFETGWQLIETQNFRVLIVKLEDIQKNQVTALNELVSQRFGEEAKISKLSSLEESLSEKKWYADIIKEFKERISFTEAELEAAYDSKYMKHFYSSEEIQKLRARWE